MLGKKTLVSLLSLLGSGGVSREETTTGSSYISSQDHDKVIVFIHGVWGDARSTWRNVKNNAYWPSLLSEDPDLQGYSIYVMNYYSPRISTASTITEIARRELQQLQDIGLFRRHERIFFITHSMGGLVAKRMIASLNHPDWDELEALDRIKAVLFLSTPAHGADVAGIASWISLNPQLKGMETADLNDHLQILEDDWVKLMLHRDKLGVPFPKAFCAYETQPTSGLSIVTRVYATTRCDSPPLPFDFNHGEMARPSSRTHQPYIWVKTRITETAKIPELSRKVAMTQTANAVVRAANNPSLVGARILWVDDNPDDNRYERQSLQELGILFVLARSTSEALMRLSDGPYIAIISDFARRDEKEAGYTLLDELRKRGEGQKYIIYSGITNEAYKKQAIMRGAFGQTNNPRELFKLVMDAIRK